MSLVNNWMGDHLGSIHFVFFSLAIIGRNIRQICHILLTSWNFGKTQIFVYEERGSNSCPIVAFTPSNVIYGQCHSSLKKE